MISPKTESPKSWTVAALLRWTEERFQELGLETPRLDAELLLAQALDCSRLELYTEHHKIVEPEERARFRGFVRRRSRREPVAYILGYREFYSLKLQVTQDVLVPRPETEHVVDVALRALGAARSGPDSDETAVAAPASAGTSEVSPGQGTGAHRRFLDVGIGSGNIAIALLANCPNALGVGVDRSAPALAIAARNAADLNVASRLRFYEGDLFAALPPGEERFHLIVSNPPYISASEYSTLMADVRAYEPRSALLDERSPERDGLGYYRAIAASAAAHLLPDGCVAVEVGADQSPAVAKIFENHNWRIRAIERDYSGIERVMVFER